MISSVPHLSINDTQSTDCLIHAESVVVSVVSWTTDTCSCVLHFLLAPGVVQEILTGKITAAGTLLNTFLILRARRAD